MTWMGREGFAGSRGVDSGGVDITARTRLNITPLTAYPVGCGSVVAECQSAE